MHNLLSTPKCISVKEAYFLSIREGNSIRIVLTSCYMKRNHLEIFGPTEYLYFIDPYPLWSVFCLEDEYGQSTSVSAAGEMTRAVHVVVREEHGGQAFCPACKDKAVRVYLGLHYTRPNWIRASYLNDSSSKASLHHRAVTSSTLLTGTSISNLGEQMGTSEV